MPFLAKLGIVSDPPNKVTAKWLAELRITGSDQSGSTRLKFRYGACLAPELRLSEVLVLALDNDRFPFETLRFLAFTISIPECCFEIEATRS